MGTSSQKSNNIRFLQLSDLHIFNATDWEAMRTQYKYFCESHRGKIDFVVVTGDLHQYNQNYIKTENFLNEILTWLSLSKDDIFIVPGNHDSKNYDGKDLHINAARRLIEQGNQDGYITYLKEDMLWKSFIEYDEFVRRFYDDNNLNPSHVQIRTWKNKINIVLLNSAILCNGVNTEPQIVDISTLSQELRNINDRLPTIILTHHEFDSYYPLHQDTLDHLLRTYKIKAVLCGDAHKTRTSYINKYKINKRSVPCFVCGKSAIEPNDEFSDVGFILYSLSNSKITSQLYSWDNHRKIFKRYPRVEKHKDTKTEGSKATNSDVALNNSVDNTDDWTIWMPDAESATKQQARFAAYTETEQVKSFITDVDVKWGISGTKGVGKTFVLQLKKRHLASKNDVINTPIHESASIDNNWGVQSVVFDDYSSKGFKDIDNIENLWKYIIIIYVINQCINKLDEQSIIEVEELKRHFRDLYSKQSIDLTTYQIASDNDIEHLQDVVERILLDESWVYIVSHDLKSLEQLYAKIKKVLLANNASFISIFIDKTDQGIEDEKNGDYFITDCLTCDRLLYMNNNCDVLRRDLDNFCAMHCDKKDKCCYGCNIFNSPHLINFKKSNNISKQYSLINIWQNIQIGLILAVYDIKKKFYGIIRVFFSIRQEALDCDIKVLGGENVRKCLAVTENLNYDKNIQRKIFEKCIEHQNQKKLFDPKFIKLDKDWAFIGVHSIKHPFVNNVHESIFDTIYRHSFDRTRDIQDYADKLTRNILQHISDKDIETERETDIQEFINNEAANMLLMYYKEKNKFLSTYWANGRNFDSFLMHIDRNVLFIQDIVRICGLMNNCNNCEGNCNACQSKYHPFSMLHGLGLLGYVIPSYLPQENQRFIDAKNVTYIRNIDQLIANRDAIYIIHPALTKYIEHKLHVEMLHFNRFILGKDIKVKRDVILETLHDHKELELDVFKNKYFSKN